MKQKLFLYFLVVLFVFVAAGCPADPPAYTITAKIGEVHEAFFPVGAALAIGENNFNSLTAYSDEVLGVFNSFTAENCMKPGILQPAQGNFVWTYADNLVDFVENRNALLRGHTLVWHSQSPSWMAPAEDKTTARNNMQAHINAVVGRYKDDIYAWDVVNEAISDNGGYRTESMWYQAYGDASYIQDAFDFARAADPDAELFYNDYNVVNGAKRQAIVDMITDLELIENHHMTGIGIQAHWNLDWPSIQTIEQTITTFKNMGLVIHITELDIIKGNATYSEDALADRYEAIFRLFREHSDAVKSVTLWGVADDHTWRTGEKPLLFDTGQNPKKAYVQVVESVDSE